MPIRDLPRSLGVENDDILVWASEICDSCVTEKGESKIAKLIVAYSMDGPSLRQKFADSTDGIAEFSTNFLKVFCSQFTPAKRKISFFAKKLCEKSFTIVFLVC